MKQRIGIITVAVLSVLLIGCGNNARNITVEDCTGTSTVTNEAQTLDAYKGQRLESGDKVEVFEASNMTLLLDADKHVFAAEGADFTIVAGGKKRQTKTIIEQSSGAMIYGIDNKLGSEETFHVKTPNATMAVRGTVFSVRVNEDGTRLEVSEGTVYVETVENGELVTDTLTVGESGEYTGEAPEIEDNKSLGETDENSGSDSSELGDKAQDGDSDMSDVIDMDNPEALEWIKNPNIEFTVDGITLGESTIDAAKAKYSGDSDYMSNLMNNDTEDTVYSAPYSGDTPEGYTSDTFGYIFAAPASGGPIKYMSITDKKCLCLGGIRSGDSAEAFLEFIGLSPDVEHADKTIYAQDDDGNYVAITGSSFFYKEGNKNVSVHINNELGKVTGIVFTMDN